MRNTGERLYGVHTGNEPYDVLNRSLGGKLNVLRPW